MKRQTEREIIAILSNYQNYQKGRQAVDIIKKASDEELLKYLRIKEIQDAILKLKNTYVLRDIFRKSPAFFQDIMFENVEMQNILISPRPGITVENIVRTYNRRKEEFGFNQNEIRALECFIRTFKNPKLREIILDNDLFQLIIASCHISNFERSFFKDLDEVKLFKNIVNNPIVFKTSINRKRNILQIFNRFSNHVLLVEDYQKILDKSEQKSIISSKNLDEDNKKIEIDKDTLLMLTNPMIDTLFGLDGADKEFIMEIYKENVISQYVSNPNYLETSFSHLLNGNNYYTNFSGIDMMSFMIISKYAYDKEEEKNRFKNFLFDVFCRSGEFSKEEKRRIEDALYAKVVSNELTKKQYDDLLTYCDAYKTIAFLKFGILSHWYFRLNGVSEEQICYLNVKHINTIKSNLKLENEDESANIYSIAIKMYMTFGLERTLKILHEDYGRLDQIFFENVLKLNVENISLIKEGKKYLPRISEGFINFMFANPKENHFKNMLAGDSYYLRLNWSYLYNNFAEIKEKCHNVITLKKVNIVLRENSPEREISDVSPDDYKLAENDILSLVCMGNKSRRSNGEVYKTLREIYHQMKSRTESSIPYVFGKASNGYSYEMMKLKDPIAFVLGYKGSCCIRVHDIAHNHLLHATLCRNGRILIIYDENREIAAFSPLKRNGEVLIANSIECTGRRKNDFAAKAFEEAVLNIISISEREEKLPIRLVCIGSSSYVKPSNCVPFKSGIKIPTILEKDDSTYRDTDCYHRKLDIVYQHPKLKLEEIKYGEVEHSYQDPRVPIETCNFKTESKEKIEKALKVINAVRYAKTPLLERDEFSYITAVNVRDCCFGEDWFIMHTVPGKTIGDYMEYDERAKTEYEICMKTVNK